jgi:secreted trypsin-like serine protease
LLSKIWTKVLLKDASDSSAKKKNIPENSIRNVTFLQGDSGGPLIYYRRQQPIQIGVLEFGSEECGFNRTSNSAFISVAHFRAWIDSILSTP